MPRKKWIDKSTAQTFHLLHRPQTDPGIHDETLPDRVLHQISGPSPLPSSSTAAASLPTSSTTTKGLHLTDLEQDLDYESIRENEGEAANYGIYYDDTEYDYMQHLRDFGEGSGEAHFVDAAPVTVKGKGKGKGKAKMVKLEDALREVDLNSDTKSHGSVSIFGDEEEGSQAPSLVKDRRLEAQQDVPDEIAGFQPDMDPRLREALEALEDDAYVDEKDEDELFGSLVADGPGSEVDIEEFEATFGEEGDDDEGWESDRTERPPPDRQSSDTPIDHDQTSDLHPLSSPDLKSTPLDPSTTSTTTTETATAEDGAWLAEFAKFKRATTTASKKPPPPEQQTSISISASAAPSSLYTLNNTPVRSKKRRRKGALTNPSAYSMTSASLARTEAQQVLDARFERVAEMYALDEDENDEDGFDGEDEDEEDGGVSIMSGMSKMSKMSSASMSSTKSFADIDREGGVRSDLEGMMDGFLEGWERGSGTKRTTTTSTAAAAGGGGNGGKRKAKGNKRGKNGNELLGIAMLDEIRRGLGPTRITT